MKTHILSSSALALVGVLTVPSARAAVTFSAADISPTLSSSSIGSTDFTNSDRQQQDYTDNAGATGPFADTAPGQTFTTGANATGYLLDSFSFATQDTNVLGGVTTFTVTVRTISGATAGLVQSFVASASASVQRSPYSGTDTASWHTVAFDGADRITLAANTVYGIDVTQGYLWTGIGRSTTAYAGGSSYYINTVTGVVTEEPSRADTAFAVGLTAVVQVTGFAAWIGNYPSLTNSDALPTADPDFDGLPNLAEYGLGANPTVADATEKQPATSVVADKLQLSFNRIADSSLVYSVEASNNLATWTSIWSSSGAENIAGPVIVPDTETVTAQPRRFLRLKITAP